MKVGEIIALDREIILNDGKDTVTITVVNIGDRPIQVGSHYHFFEVNKLLKFNREKSYGYRLNIPSGTSVRFEPGEEKEIQLVELGGKRIVYGLNDLTEKKVKKAIKACYGKNPAFIIGIALNEKFKKDNENFGIVTNSILSILEKMDKEDRNEILKKYAKRRRDKGCQCSRRLNLLSINEDDYKNINKSVAKLIRNGFNKEVFS